MTQKNKKNRSDVDFSASPQQENEIEDFGPVIYQYTRAQAIEDGVLIDATLQAQSMGIQFPVVLTSAAWSACIDGQHVAQPGPEEVRLYHVLNGLLRAALQNDDVGDTSLKLCVPVLTTDRRLTSVELKAVCGPGDDGKVVITVMLPNED